jgi:hypothetical protein
MTIVNKLSFVCALFTTQKFILHKSIKFDKTCYKHSLQVYMVRKIMEGLFGSFISYILNVGEYFYRKNFPFYLIKKEN